ncbi:hypothetical protein SAMN04487910_0004 [Aquimarina amphilecti]|uniref:DUF8213 domain-containing protein n=1 Tax=Aquimarina amphilecti TaxID=1038014 RepID=A0A1H7FA77_AQUAM|nr:hypothetical protein [Aquimarina amphilecti]SEK22247.1 hypothetical protein SAMN04487910_0004 [Aquimarina amphilecti]
MKNYVSFIAILLCALLFVQCTQENISPQAEEIGLEIENENQFSGKLYTNNSNITYSIEAISELKFIIDLTIDKKTIEASVDYEKEGITINGHNNNFTELQKEALLNTGKVISEYLLATKKGEISMTEYTLLSLIEYWGKSPVNYVYSKREITSAPNPNALKSRNEGITCIRKNTYVNAEYDDSRGNHKDRVKVGSKPRNNYGCMGRCGGDCGRWWIPSAWTKDCMDHDQCSNVNNASGGSSDGNCGDEFNEAADDYVFGVIRGCRG